MRRHLILISLALLSAPAFAEETDAAADVPAATLSAQEGTVLVNQGEEFVTASSLQALNPGDRVMVLQGGRAELTFADSCILAIEGGSLLDVPAVSTCASGQIASMQQVGPMVAQAVGAPSETDERRSNRGVAWMVVGASLVFLAELSEEMRIEYRQAVSP